MTEETMTIEELHDFPLDDDPGFVTCLAEYDWTDEELETLHGWLVRDRKATADALGKQVEVVERCHFFDLSSSLFDAFYTAITTENPTESEQLITGSAGASARSTDPNSVGGKLDLTARSRLLDARVWRVWNRLEKRPISERQRNELERQQSFGAGTSGLIKEGQGEM